MAMRDDRFCADVRDDYEGGAQFALRVGDLSPHGEDPLLEALRRHHKISDVVVVRIRTARRERLAAAPQREVA